MSGTRRRLVIPCASAAALAGAVLGWALLWPQSPCADPVCAKPRFSVFVELDAIERVNPVPLEVTMRDQRTSIAAVMATGGIDVNIVLDQTHLPYDPSAGNLNDADLFQLAHAWSNRDAPAHANAKLYAIVAPRLVSNTGEALFGIMFDTVGREGFAVAPVETVKRFTPATSQLIPTLQMRTFLHELLHALNRNHLDAARLQDGRLTVEAPTKCIADTRSIPWSLQDPPSWALSPATIQFFQTAAAADVLPGKANKPYELRRTSADECQELRERPASTPAGSRWTLAQRRLRHLLSLSMKTARAAGPPSRTAQSGKVELQLQALPAAYPLGYPIAIRLIATNGGPRPVPLRGRLRPSFGLVQIDTRNAGHSEWRTLQPSAWFEPADDTKAMLDPGQSTEQTVPIYFGEDGWTFPVAGAYDLRARMTSGDAAEEAITPPVRIEVAAPPTERDAAAVQLLLDADGQLDVDTGRLLNFAGRVGEPADLTPVERLVSEFSDTALGSAYQLTLASYKLRRPLNPETGVRPAPDRAGARAYLSGACTDSGIAALSLELAQTHDAPVDEGEHVAWDGLSPGRSTRRRTYSDASLVAAPGPSIHFCTDERRMRNGAWSGAHRLARAVRAAKPVRVVVIGHADDQGGCRYNEELGLMRAESVKHVLVKSGVPSKLIQTVTLGERRPLQFSSTQAARMLNRRVEVLIEPRKRDAARNIKSGSTGRALPSCPSGWIRSMTSMDAS